MLIYMLSKIFPWATFDEILEFRIEYYFMWFLFGIKPGSSFNWKQWLGFKFLLTI